MEDAGIRIRLVLYGRPSSSIGTCETHDLAAEGQLEETFAKCLRKVLPEHSENDKVRLLVLVVVSDQAVKHRSNTFHHASRPHQKRCEPS